MLRIVQAGSGPRRILVIAYFTANTKALLRALPATACVMVDLDDAAGRFARPAGRSGVETIGVAVARAQCEAWFESPLAVVLIGWSAGCQAVREQLRAGPAVDAVLALDGISGDVPPREDQLEPWRSIAARARAEEACFVIAHTAMGYTERLPPAKRYASTTHTAALITGTIGEAPPATGEITPIDGSLYVLAYPSKDIDGAAHLYQQTTAMPDLLARVIVPWLIDRGYELPDVPAPASRDAIPPPPPTMPTGSIHPTPPSRSELPTIAEEPRALRRGDHGPDVVELQTRLNVLGFKLTVDGSFGPKTNAAVKDFQLRSSVGADGVVDHSTRTALDLAIAAAKRAPTEPPPSADRATDIDAAPARGMGAAVLEQARRALAAGVCEHPAGSNRGTEIDGYFTGCVRGHKPFGMRGLAWCAAAASAWLWTACYPEGDGDALALAWTALGRLSGAYVPPVGRRAAVSELVQDAMHTGTWRERDAVPEPGWLAIFKRGGHDPRRGTEGHVEVVEVFIGPGYVAIGGNVGNRVTRTTHSLLGESTGNELVGWIEVG